MGLFYVFGTILFTVYGQLIIKWQVNIAGELPASVSGKTWYLFHLLLNPWVISSLFAAFLAALCWMSAMTKLELSYAYPFMSLSFVLVFILSLFFFHESFTMIKLLGMLLIISGVIVLGQSA